MYATMPSRPTIAIENTTMMTIAMLVDRDGTLSKRPCRSKKVMLIAIIDTRAGGG
jgi:hypothetical protein